MSSESYGKVLPAVRFIAKRKSTCDTLETIWRMARTTRRKAPMKRWCCLGVLLVWTLWIRTQGPTVDSWSAATGFPNQEKCLASMKEKLDLWRQFKDAKFTANAVTFTDTHTSMTYYCLIDTEDPRRKTK
jgi:hypothetical protein